MTKGVLMNPQILSSLIQLGEPAAHGGVVIAPLFPRLQPQADYLTLAEAIPLGLTVSEVDAAGSVPELLVSNPLEGNVLLYDGEELIGAKQNRILNVTVLVAAQSETRIPVSCVEAGRWSARSSSFAAARHASHPQLRRRKAESLSAQPLALGLAQSEVWAEIDEKAKRLDTASPTRAQADIFTQRERQLDKLRAAFPLQPGQCGAILALGDDLVCLDYLSRPQAFAQLYSKLLDGYLLDALERLDNKPIEPEQIQRFVDAIERAPRSRRHSAGLGDDLRLRGDGVVGSGLELDGELLQLCTFTSAGAVQPETRVARPSRRR
jgi:hypothetical protein